MKVERLLLTLKKKKQKQCEKNTINDCANKSEKTR